MARATVLGLVEAGRDDDHVVLESARFQLVVLRIPTALSQHIEITVPPTRRASAAVKLVFFVPNLAETRLIVGNEGGVMNPADKEWTFEGCLVCDGLDPEGNVVQFRQPAPAAP